MQFHVMIESYSAEDSVRICLAKPSQGSVKVKVSRRCENIAAHITQLLIVVVTQKLESSLAKLQEKYEKVKQVWDQRVHVARQVEKRSEARYKAAGAAFSKADKPSIIHDIASV